MYDLLIFVDCCSPVFDSKDLVVVGGSLKYHVEVLTVSVGDEDLAEVVIADKVDNAFHSVCIEFVEDVVEK